ncbi:MULTISPECIES: M24 family metallopeptidase [Halolamina]|uniref:Xaa-Pro aminopeptidase n=1 Tax=Halolamina pelagica TaxID=699431 RepID=A0A1I5NME9_9EURY|nr:MULTISPECIES: Xaa-Pro peptidase family protein [Halolamina]NHX36387.1 aminopeptidase P family protein [Halolamina sp. R1-12]SFP22887.1 Xaa-Pro aminopeptidase [Halolamina pelagica]
MTDSETFRRRVREAKRRLRERGDDALVLFPSRNLQYLADFAEEPGERHLLLFVPAEGEPVFFAPELYGDQLREASWVADVRTWGDTEDPVPRIADIAAELDLGTGRVLVDDTMWALFTQDLRTALPEATFGLAREVLSDLRVRKDAAELDAMERAAAVADETVRDLRELGEDAIGLTEAELAAEIEDSLERNGGTGVSFDTIVGSGPDGAKPHHHHGEREIRPGDPVVLDFGTRVDGYPSDQTRTLVFGGEASEQVREVHDLVREAQQAGVDAVEPGVTAESVDAAAREVIEAAGYGEQFIHRTGHGVGLDVHEEPYIVGGNERELEPGMVFSVEPGIYHPGEFGVRIEDLVVVTEDGCERLNDTDRGWRC